MADKKGMEQVVLRILDGEEGVDARNGLTNGSVASFPDFEPKETRSLRCAITQSVVESSPSHEISRMSSSKPPKIPVESAVRRPSFARSSFSKPKSRLIEPPRPDGASLAEENAQAKSASGSPFSSSPKMDSPAKIATATSPKESLKSAPITPRTPLVGSTGSEEEDDEEVYKTAELKVKEKSRKKLKRAVVIEWIAFLCITACLISSLTIDKLLTKEIWGLGLWKWCVLVLVIFCGRLFSQWFINCLVFLIERNFLLKRKVLYFVYGLRKSVIVFIWLALVLLAWGLLFDQSIKRSKKVNEILNYVTRALAASLIGAGLWLVKTLLVKILAASFQCTRFFDRIQESIFHQYILRTLSGPPLMEMAERVGGAASSGQLSFRHLKKERDGGNEGKEEVIDVDKLKKMKQEKVSAWTMRGLINVIRSSGLSTISNTIENFKEEEGEQKDKEINSEWEASAAAYQIFRNVAKPGSKYIDEEDLFRFMNKEEIDNVLPLFEGGVETGKIKRKTLKNWLVNVYIERKSLAHSLNDTKTAIEELNRLASAFVLIVIIIVWLLLMGFLTTQVLVFISSQLLLVVFMFGNTAKTIFEAIIFVFVMHPFDVGDRCVVDGVQMIVEEMNILTTIFLRYDNEKIFYPNSVLATKPISNFYRSPEMSDSIDFSVDFSTSIESIGALKARIKSYLESKPQFWRPNHSVIVKEIENVNKMKLSLYINHTINFQNYGDRSSRRSDLVLELKKIFEDLGIKYHLLPQEVQLNYLSSVAPMVSTTLRR
ncbi:mechanosensitive ion channel protein 10-like [Cucurbita moschata]|uniref:Mechanosensitive ion channel protein n=1 Tax=Cucurbita moschata TaxID=3662 RepID=A0A6J1H896_CUCMO|nr:mechanosensitive ion channel protein 10-like [Cucurbita moschata]XP_022960738.1 mechanosensitive ion channel protein 10-like [Cucurbita moschata]